MTFFWLAAGAALLLIAGGVLLFTAGYALPKLLPLAYSARHQRDRHRYVMAYRTRATEALQRDGQRIDHASVVNAANALYSGNPEKPNGLENPTL